MTLFRVSTGEDWFKIMFDTTRDKENYNCTPDDSCGSSISFYLAYYVIFFIFFIIIISYVMLNLFVLVMMSNFE